MFLILHFNSLYLTQVSAMSPIFGYLDFHPPNGFKFWELLEFYLDVKFNQFTPVSNNIYNFII